MAVNRHPRPWGWLTAALFLVAVVQFADRSLLQQGDRPLQRSLNAEGDREGYLWQWEWRTESVTDVRWSRPGHAVPDSLELAGRPTAAWQAWNVLRQADSTDFRAWKMWGQLALRRGEVEAARNALLVASNLDAKDFGLWQSLGLAWIQLDQPAFATVAFDRASSVDPQDARSRLNAGIALLRQSQWEAALDRLDAASERASGALSAKVAAYRGQALRGLGRKAQAEQAYAQAISLDPDQLLARLGQSELIEDAAERLTALGKLSRLYPDRAVVQWAHGQALRSFGRDAEAEVALDRAMELAPDEPRFARDLMRLYLDRDEVEAAQTLLDNRFAAALRSPERWFLRAKLEADAGDDLRAVALYDSALAASDGRMADAWLNRGAALRRLGRFEEALDSYRVALKEREAYPEAWFNIGVGLSEAGDREGAIEAYQKSLEINANQPRAWFNLGVQWRRMEAYDKALGAWERAVNLDPAYVLAWYNLAVNRARLGRPDAGSTLDQLVQRFPDFTKGWSERAEWLQSEGRLAESAAACRELLARDPDDVRTWRRLGGLLHDLSDEEGALQAFQEVVERTPDQYQGRFNLGLQLERMGRDAEAVVQYRRSHQLKGEFTRPLERIRDMGQSLGRDDLVWWANDHLLPPGMVQSWGADSVYGYARALHRLDLQQEARVRYGEALELGKEGVWPRYWSAKAAEELGLWDEAAVGYDGVLGLRSDFKYALYRLALLEARTNVEAGRRRWASLEAAHPEFAAEKAEEKP